MRFVWVRLRFPEPRASCIYVSLELPSTSRLLSPKIRGGVGPWPGYVIMNLGSQKSNAPNGAMDLCFHFPCLLHILDKVTRKKAVGTRCYCCQTDNGYPPLSLKWTTNIKLEAFFSVLSPTGFTRLRQLSPSSTLPFFVSQLISFMNPITHCLGLFLPLSSFIIQDHSLWCPILDMMLHACAIMTFG